MFSDWGFSWGGWLDNRRGEWWLLAQLLLTSYRQPDGDLFGSQNGQIGTQMSPLDGSMRCREVPTKFPFTGHLGGTSLAR